MFGHPYWSPAICNYKEVKVLRLTYINSGWQVIAFGCECSK